MTVAHRTSTVKYLTTASYATLNIYTFTLQESLCQAAPAAPAVIIYSINKLPVSLNSLSQCRQFTFCRYSLPAYHVMESRVGHFGCLRRMGISSCQLASVSGQLITATFSTQYCLFTEG